MTPPTVTELIRKLQQKQFKAYLVGGCVRDLVINRKPKDWDVATSALPEQVLELFPSGQLVGASFGVVNIPLRCHLCGLAPAESQCCLSSFHDPGTPDHVEVATFRKDGVYSDGRRPDTVEYTTSPEIDSNRRDFTMNALYCDPFGNGDGILDFHGGMKDLKKGIIRTVGFPQYRFQEDYLRMLRAVRFSVQLNFWLDRYTREAIERLAPEIVKISAERIRGEMDRMIECGRFFRGLRLMDEVRLLEQILPEVDNLQGVEQPPEFHPEGDVWTHTLMAMEDLMAGEQFSADLAVNWGMLLHDIGKPATQEFSGPKISFKGHDEVGASMVKTILGRLKYPNETIDQVEWLVSNHMRFYRLPEMRLAKVKTIMAHPLFTKLTTLCSCDCSASCQDFVDMAVWVNEMARKHPPEETRKVVPLVTGDDLIAAGFKPGPAFKTILQNILDAQLEGTITTKEQGLAIAFETTISQ
jgi:poly(A) polymerase